MHYVAHTVGGYNVTSLVHVLATVHVICAQTSSMCFASRAPNKPNWLFLSVAVGTADNHLSPRPKLARLLSIA